MMNQQQMEQTILDLQRQINALKQSSTIPLDIDRSFVGRGYMKSISINQIDPLDYISLSTSLSLTGNPQIINVPAFPWRYARLQGSQNYYVPLMVLAEFS